MLAGSPDPDAVPRTAAAGSGQQGERTDVAEPTAASSQPNQGGDLMDDDGGVLRRPAGARRRLESAVLENKIARKVLRDEFERLKACGRLRKAQRFRNKAAVFMFLGPVRGRDASAPQQPTVLFSRKFEPLAPFEALMAAHARGEDVDLSSDSYSELDDLEENTAVASGSGDPDSGAAKRRRTA